MKGSRPFCESFVKVACYAALMPTKRAESLTYQSYLVRFWRDKPTGFWRVSLQSTATEELRHFATLDAYWSFLQTRLSGAPNVLETLPETR